MAAETPQKGIGATFHVHGDTRAMREMFSTLRGAGIQTIDPSDAHVTIVDSAETQIPVFSERDQLSLNRARAEASAYLATMPYYELVLSPEEPKLAVFGKRLGILIAEQDFFLSVRRFVGGIFEEEANIRLSDRSYIAHLSVGFRNRGASAAAKGIKNPKIPRRLHIDGHDVSERVFTEQSGRQRSGQIYVNSKRGRDLHSVA